MQRWLFNKKWNEYLSFQGNLLRYFILIVLWICWCTLHSLLISSATTAAMQKKLAERYRYYRIAYNFLAVATLLPLIAYGNTLKGEPVLSWSGALVIVQVLLFLLALVLFAAGAMKYDLGQFTGTAQVRSGISSTILTGNGRLDVSGIHQVTRHPWYFGGLLILWSYQPGIDLQSLLTNIVLSVYLIIGAMLEEKKLLLLFGEEYRRYKKDVSMFFPLKWILDKGRSH